VLGGNVAAAICRHVVTRRSVRPASPIDDLEEPPRMPSRRLIDAARIMGAREVARIRISRGQHPRYLVAIGPDHGWRVLDAPWLSGTASSRHHAVLRAHIALAAWLGVPFDSFELVA
jgi:hypothetical protein